MDTKITRRDNRYDRLKKGFNQEEEKEFDQVFSFCSSSETENNIEYQGRLFNVIRSIIDNNELDYISKLEKLNVLLATNKSLRSYKKSLYNQNKSTQKI